MYTYERIAEGVIRLESMSTPVLKQLLADTTDVRIKDRIGTIMMYDRAQKTLDKIRGCGIVVIHK